MRAAAVLEGAGTVRALATLTRAYLAMPDAPVQVVDAVAGGLARLAARLA